MKKIILFSFLFSAVISINAQEWQTDMDTAKKIATNKKQHIILVFQGSDWCGPCIKLDKEIWSTQEFKDYSKDHFVMLKADFPKRKKNKLSDSQQEKNNKLAEKYNKNAHFPFVLVLNELGQTLGATGYKNVSPTQYIKILNSF